MWWFLTLLLLQTYERVPLQRKFGFICKKVSTTPKVHTMAGRTRLHRGDLDKMADSDAA